MAHAAKTAPLCAARRQEPAARSPSSPAAGRKSWSGDDNNNSFRHLDAALADMTMAEWQAFFPESVEKRKLRPSSSFLRPRSSSCSNISADSGDTFRDLDEVLAHIRQQDGARSAADTPKASGQSALAGKSAAQFPKGDNPANLPTMRRTTREASQAPPLPLPEPPSLKGRFARKFKSLVASLSPRGSARPPYAL